MVFILAERAQQCSLLTCFDLWTVEQVAIIGGIHKDSTKISAKNSLENSFELGYTYDCLHARSIVNKTKQMNKTLW